MFSDSSNDNNVRNNQDIRWQQTQMLYLQRQQQLQQQQFGLNNTKFNGNNNCLSRIGVNNNNNNNNRRNNNNSGIYNIHDRFTVHQKIGEGTYGTVYKCTDNLTGQVVAHKRMRLFSPQDTYNSNFDAINGNINDYANFEGISSTVIREISILRELSYHPNIIRLLDVINCSSGGGGGGGNFFGNNDNFNNSFITGNGGNRKSGPESSRIVLVFEYLDRDLKNYLDHRHSSAASLPLSRTGENNKISRAHVVGVELKKIMYQLLSGIHACHSRRIMHRDLKPQNILCNKDATVVKIADFGLSRPLFHVPGTGSRIGILEDFEVNTESSNSPGAKCTSGDRNLAPVINSAYSDNFMTYTHDVVTMWYRAPELLLGCRHYLPAVDIWSLGCIMAELATHRPLFCGDCEINQLFCIFQLLGTPFDGGKENGNMDNIHINGGSRDKEGPMEVGHKLNGGKPSAFWPFISFLPDFNTSFPIWNRVDLKQRFHPFIDEVGVDLLSRMLEYHPYNRITAYAALQHPWFDEVRAEMVERERNFVYGSLNNFNNNEVNKDGNNNVNNINKDNKNNFIGNGDNINKNSSNKTINLNTVAPIDDISVSSNNNVNKNEEDVFVNSKGNNNGNAVAAY